MTIFITIVRTGVSTGTTGIERNGHQRTYFCTVCASLPNSRSLLDPNCGNFSWAWPLTFPTMQWSLTSFPHHTILQSNFLREYKDGNYVNLNLLAG